MRYFTDLYSLFIELFKCEHKEVSPVVKRVMKVTQASGVRYSTK